MPSLNRILCIDNWCSTDVKILTSPLGGGEQVRDLRERGEVCWAEVPRPAARGRGPGHGAGRGAGEPANHSTADGHVTTILRSDWCRCSRWSTPPAPSSCPRQRCTGGPSAEVICYRYKLKIRRILKILNIFKKYLQFLKNIFNFFKVFSKS